MRKFCLFMMSLSLLTVFMVTASVEKAQAQGCVAIRSTGGYAAAEKAMADTATKYEFSVNNRYFRSFRHYVGLAEQKQRQTLGNEVINHSYTMDLNLVRHLNARWSIMVDMPILDNMRSQTYTQDNVLHRFATHSFGIGDIRFAAYAWVINPNKSPRGNIQVGLGLKLPTGAYNYQDYFQTSDTTRQYGPVDQSIQLGDGGTGITTEINAFYNLSPKFSVYGNWYYLISPRDQNGTNNYHSPTPSASSVANGSNVMSVPDQLMARIGFDYMVKSFTFSAGVREECLPVHDLVGGSDGFRRPGYIIDAEPGISYTKAKTTLYLFVPVALVRDRTQSVPDKISTALTGKFTQGDAAFADYVINVGATFRF
ncbi:MAG: hypothetical protein Q8927_08815 [Bacteroidota bacterium]|nr:hypothetical protein [Bacteroidota bacterium]MDP4255208.1 hypothetical protein [Bacteroidota bacterium]